MSIAQMSGCISYYSYIKPQLQPLCRCYPPVVYRTIPTSNHNIFFCRVYRMPLYIVLFLHQTTTWKLYNLAIKGCISYYSYIKPQLWKQSFILFNVVYRTIPTSNHNYKTIGLSCASVVYRTIPTSNHNSSLSAAVAARLYIVLFLHQTTTRFP